MEATERLRRQGLRNGGIAKGCGKVMSNRRKYKNVKNGLDNMVQTKLGRYWEQTKRWFVCKVWPFKTKEGREEEVSKMRASSQSEIYDRGAEKICRCQETGSCQCGT